MVKGSLDGGFVWIIVSGVLDSSVEQEVRCWHGLDGYDYGVRYH